jgi:hypothetical protein
MVSSFIKDHGGAWVVAMHDTAKVNDMADGRFLKTQISKNAASTPLHAMVIDSDGWRFIRSSIFEQFIIRRKKIAFMVLYTGPFETHSSSDRSRWLSINAHVPY